MSKYTEAIERYKHWYERGFNHSDMPSSGMLVTMGEALEIADRLEQADDISAQRICAKYCTFHCDCTECPFTLRDTFCPRTHDFVYGYNAALADVRGDAE